jgi:signal peptidase I
VPRGLRLAYKLGRGVFAAVVIALLLGYGAIFALHLEPETMLTGSMGTTIPPGSLVLTRSTAPTTLRVGDVITFQKPTGQAGLDTHRIVRIKQSNTHTTYWTKGDANSKPDSWAIEFRPGQRAHRVIHSFPVAGRLLLWARGPTWAYILATAIGLTLLSTIVKVIVASSSAENHTPTGASSP